MAAISKALRYFAILFAFAFVMGVIRTLFVAPRIGAAAAVGFEVPIVLCASWFVARRLLRDGSLSLTQRAAMGAIAFILLMISEAALSVVMRGESIAIWAANLVTPLGLLGLASQIGFALMPLLVARRAGTSPQPIV